MLLASLHLHVDTLDHELEVGFEELLKRKSETRYTQCEAGHFISRRWDG